MARTEKASLTVVAECHQPLLLEITALACSCPQEIANFCTTSTSVAQLVSHVAKALWEGTFATRWPMLHDCHSFHCERDWKEAYRGVLFGERECLLEVFEREKKLGFVMSAFPAKVTYNKAKRGFIARYLSASEVAPETIMEAEAHRLRFCPPSARAQLAPGIAPGVEPGEAYPYRVLEGHKHLVVGQGVELQWKMQEGSPFGWWYGHLEHLSPDPDERMATATIVFKHFPSTSDWYRWAVRFGGSDVRRGQQGGYTGGIRAASASEHRHWMRFFPR